MVEPALTRTRSASTFFLQSKFLRIADEILDHRLGEHRDVQLVGRLADILDATVLVKNVDGRFLGMIGVVGRHPLQEHEAGVIHGEMELFSDGMEQLIDVIRVERRLGELDLEKVTVEQTTAELPEHKILVVVP